jgi:hypothetical protein
MGRNRRTKKYRKIREEKRKTRKEEKESGRITKSYSQKELRKRISN